jgi:hypothetical protein
MSTRRSIVLFALLSALLFLLVDMRPAAAESLAFNPDVGEAQMAIDLFAVRSTSELNVQAAGAALIFGLSTRATAIVQFSSESLPDAMNNSSALVFEGRVRIYLGHRGRHLSKEPLTETSFPVDKRSPR